MVRDGMVDEFRAQFLPKFVEETRTRLRTAISMLPPAGPAGTEGAKAIVALMESLTGEALLIGLSSVALLGRAAAAAARRYIELHNDAALVACMRTLRTLSRAIEELALPPSDSAPVAPVLSESQEFLGVRVLIVDDSPLNAELMREALIPHGFNVSTAGDDFDLILQRLRELRPQVLLVDWLMPRCNTRTLCRHVRSTPEFASIRVILISSIPQQEATRLAKSMGIDGALSKEHGASAIAECVRSVLREPR